MGSNYKGNKAGIGELNLCEADAKYMESQIRKVGKFDTVKVILGRSLTKRNIKREIHKLARRASKDDTVFLYFAGHGFFLQDPNSKNGMSNYIVCYDRPHLSDVELNQYLKEIKSPKTLFAFDCCFSGGIAKKGKKTRGAGAVPIPNGKDGTVRQNPEDFYFQNKAIIASSDDDQTSIELGGRINHGVFTYNFGRAMESADLNGDKVVTALEAFFKTKRDVERMAARVSHEQVPQISGNASGIILKGTKPKKITPPKIDPIPVPPPSPEPHYDPPKPAPVEPVVTPEEPEVVVNEDFGEVLIRTSIVRDRKYGIKMLPPAEMIRLKKTRKGKRKVKLFISGKEYPITLRSRKSKFWGSSSLGGRIRYGRVYDIFLKRVPAGVHSITLRADDYPEMTRSFAVLANQKNVLQMTNAMSGFGVIEGRVFYKTLDNPVYRQPIYMPTVKTVNGIHKVKTNRKGYFWFTNLIPGDYEVKASFAESLELNNATIKVTEGKTTKVQVILNTLLPGAKPKYWPKGTKKVFKKSDFLRK
ncbi:MAG: caspase family protein [Spirochaetota bacterium]